MLPERAVFVCVAAGAIFLAAVHPGYCPAETAGSAVGQPPRETGVETPVPDVESDDAFEEMAMEEAFEFKRADDPEPVSDREEAAWRQWVAAGRFTACHEVSRGTGISEWITNRASLRLEWHRFFMNRYLFLFDGKALAYFQNDHRLGAEPGRSLKLTGNIREFYLQAGFDYVSLKLGRQIMDWGDAESADVTDVVSPCDNRELSFGTDDETRVGQTMISADFHGPWGTLTAFANPDPQVNIDPERGTRYYQPPTGGEDHPPVKIRPERFDMEYGLRLRKTVGPADFSLIMGDMYANSPVSEWTGFQPDGSARLTEIYPRYQMLGGTLILIRGNYLLTAEVAYKNDLALQGHDAGGRAKAVRGPAADTALGLEYDANGVYTLYLELSNRYLIDFSEELDTDEDTDPRFYLNLSKQFRHDTVDCDYSFSYHLRDEDSYHRMEIGYDFSDAWRFKVSYMMYASPQYNSPMWGYRDEDRVTLEIKRYF